MKESFIENTCVEYAKKKGYTSRKVQFIQQNGAPDRIFYKKGDFIWVEFKTSGGVISELQKHEQQLLKQSGQQVFNVWSIDQFKEIIS